MTEASSVLGANTAVAFSKKVADVVLVARNQAKLDKVKADCQKAGKKPLVVNADLVKIIDTTITKYGKLDILITNAGFGRKVLFNSEDFLKVFNEVLALNLRSVINLTHLAAPHLSMTKGNIVNISSVGALKTIGSSADYCTAKAGFDHFARCIAFELATKGVKVKIINPGPVKTDFIENMGIQVVKRLFTNKANLMPLKRISELEEISDVILFLASDKARGITTITG